MLTQTEQGYASNQETSRTLLFGAKAYLKTLLNDKVPDSLVSTAWEDFYRTCDDLIRQFVLAQGVSWSDVDDCVQEVWSKVAVRLIEFDRPACLPGLRAWLYALARGTCEPGYVSP